MTFIFPSYPVFLVCLFVFLNLYKTGLLEFTKLDLDRTLRTRLVQNHVWNHEGGPWV